MLVVELNGVQFGSIPLHYIRFGIVKTIVNISFSSSLVGCLEKALKFYWLFCFSVAFLLAGKNI